MKLYSSDNNYKLYHGNMLDMLGEIETNSIDSVVTDPPYELNFMNKGWDNQGVAFQPETWRRCYEVLKPGGYLLAFGGSRTFHRIACAIEDAGFEIRDTIMWVYGSGFPKSMNIGKAIECKLTTGSANTQEFKNLQGEKAPSGDWGMSKNSFDYGARPSDYSADGHMRTVKVDYSTKEGEKWDGWGTALKPAYEPIIVARKPCEGSCIDNVLEWGVGGINIEGCRIGDDIITGGTTPNFRDVGRKQKEIYGEDKLSFGQISNAERIELEDHEGRFPANLILTYDETDEEEVCSGFPCEINGSAARYFYCAKASKKDRDEGCSLLQEGVGHAKCNGLDRICQFCGVPQRESERCTCPVKSWVARPRKNLHPTVKPTELMQYLVRLVTPEGGTILDPFNGSGSTGKATMWENKERNSRYKYIGIELTDEYLPISKARIEYVGNSDFIFEDNEYSVSDQGEPKFKQMSIFDLLESHKT